MSLSKLLVASSIMLLSTSAFAFEGVLHVRATLGAMGSIDSQINIRENGDMRTDTTLPMGDMKITTIHKSGASAILQILHAQKEYMEMPMPQEMAPGAKGPEAGQFDIKRIGKEKVGAYQAEHVQLVDKKSGMAIDMWVSKEVGISNPSELMAQSGGSAAAFVGLLKSKGVEGYPLKIAMKQGGQEMTIETTKVEKRKLTADLFEVPKGYKKSAMPAMPMMMSPGMMPPSGAPPAGAQPK